MTTNSPSHPDALDRSPFDPTAMTSAPTSPTAQSATAMTKPPPSSRRWWSWLARLAITIGLLAFVYWRLDARAVFSHLTGIHLGWYALGALIAITAQGLLATNLRWALRMFGADVTLASAFHAHSIGNFANLFLPSSIGGDVVKSVALRKTASGIVPATSAVLLARGLGVFGVITVAAVGTLFADMHLPGSHIPRMVAVTLGLASTALLLGWLLRGKLARLGTRLCPTKLKPKFVPVFDVVATLRLSDLAGPALIAIGYGFLASLWNCCFGVALGMPINFEVFAFVVPLVFLATLLPISIQGLGVRDKSYTYLLGLFGTAPEMAAAFALLDFSGRVLIGLSGGVFVVFASRRQVAQSPSPLSAEGENLESPATRPATVSIPLSVPLSFDSADSR